jgi:hypothetical protein
MFLEALPWGHSVETPGPMEENSPPALRSIGGILLLTLGLLLVGGCEDTRIETLK